MLTLGDLAREGRRLVARCNGCGWQRARTPSSIAVAHTTPVGEVARVMRCSKCGGRDILTLPQVVWDGGPVSVASDGTAASAAHVGARRTLSHRL